MLNSFIGVILYTKCCYFSTSIRDYSQQNFFLIIYSQNNLIATSVKQDIFQLRKDIISFQNSFSKSKNKTNSLIVFFSYICSLNLLYLIINKIMITNNQKDISTL